MKLYENNYKGKWHVYDDEPDEMCGDNGTIDSGEVTDEMLLNHAEACDYYGIPMYTGKNEEFKARCDYAWKKYIALSEATE